MQQEVNAAPCPDCGSAVPVDALSCPQCRRLTHGSELTTLATEARSAAARGDVRAERTHWEQATRLLPSDTVQYRSIQSRLAELEALESQPAQSHKGGWKKALIALGPAAFLVWKLKGVLLALLTKGKVLLLGFTKMGTLLSMAASFGVYWELYGWGLAGGLILSIYIHEMGHVIALRRYGIPASAPMFIPGIGAFIRLRSLTLGAIEDARIGLAGPLYGLGAALLAMGMHSLTQVKLWAAIAAFGAMINLFNMIPVWQLDGARGMRSQTFAQRRLLLIASIALWIFTLNGILLLVAAGIVYRMFRKDYAPAPDWQGFAFYAGLMAALSWLTMWVGPVASIP
jgi:Zn-dependent protease